MCSKKVKRSGHISLAGTLALTTLLIAGSAFDRSEAKSSRASGAIQETFPEGPCRRLMRLDASRLEPSISAKALATLDASVSKLAANAKLAKCVQVGRWTVPIIPRKASTQPISLKRPIEHEQGGKAPLQSIPPGATLSREAGPEVKIISIPRLPLPKGASPPSSDPSDPSVEVFVRTEIPGDASWPEENQAASGHGVVLYAGNSQAYYSIDEGHSFTPISPATVFGAVEGGFCCDQLVRYARSVNRFLWLIQGNCQAACSGPNENRYRLAVATPEAIRAAARGGQPVEGAWTLFDLTPALFGDTTWYDFPDMSVSDRFLYMIWDRVYAGGSLATRVSLAQIAAGEPTPMYQWNPLRPLFGRAVQNPGDIGYFVTADADSDATKADVYFSFANSPLLFMTPASHKPIPDYDYSSDTGFSVPASPSSLGPGLAGDDWANRKPITGASIGGATIAGHQDQLWLAWTGGRRYTGRATKMFSQPHIHYIGYRLPSLTRIREGDMYNRDYAIEFPYLNSDRAGDVAISFAYGGPTTPNRPAAGILVSADSPMAPPFLLDVGVGDAINPFTIPPGVSVNRTQGDYTTIQPDGDNPSLLVTGGPFDRYDLVDGARIPRDHWEFVRFGISAPLAPPHVRIISPPDGYAFPNDMLQAFHGSAVDWSNAPLTDPMQLQWSEDGIPFATGTTTTLGSRLRPATVGDHTIQLTAIDAAGRTGSRLIHVQVTSATADGDPSVVIDSPTDGLNHPNEAEEIILAAHGNEASGRLLQGSDVRWTDVYQDARGIRRTVDLGSSLSLNRALYYNGTSPTDNTLSITATDPISHRSVSDTVQITIGTY